MLKPNKRIIFIHVALALSLLSACQSVAYYSQSVIGHSRLMMARLPVDKAVINAEPELAEKLRLSKRLKLFASQQLALPSSNSYSSYVALERDYPVWVVVAAPKYSLDAKQWCYLVIGCASYRGYFSEQAARKFATKLEQQGLETSVGGASAYSTLGWFADPLLPSMMRGSEAAFSEVLFHEIAHQRLYLKGQSGFNEAFASFVGEQGAKRWLQASKPHELPAYQDRLMAERDFFELINQLKSGLLGVYQSPHSDVEKEQRKQQLLNEFRQLYQVMKAERWQNRGYYDRWLSTPINNARLAGFSTYYDLMPKMEFLFEECDGDFKRFYARLEQQVNIDDLDDC